MEELGASLKAPFKPNSKTPFSINVRERVKPSLPSGFYGNAFMLGCTQTNVKDLTEKGLGYTTILVKRAKERVDSEFVKSVVESTIRSRASPDSVGVLILSQWSRLGLEKTDAVKAMVAVPASATQRYEHLVMSFCS
ncbi:hypothetical protein V6N13_071072 [Hibiscus sabdariffa]|uniref:Uncharacterized protein n=1 Tax=Hibiscus sabdariffa TaxID=183260 RepID=A0ABR2TEI8_9ROSI